jgi:hypothetical protein
VSSSAFAVWCRIVCVHINDCGRRQESVFVNLTDAFEPGPALLPEEAADWGKLGQEHLSRLGRGEDLAPLRPRYRALIDRSLAIDPQCGAAYFARAMWSNDDPHQRDADFRRGAELDPSNGGALTAYADFLKWEYPDADPGDSARVLQTLVNVHNGYRCDSAVVRA